MSEELGTEGADASNPVTRLPLNAQVHRSLRRDILYGKIPPGTHLSQQQLCEKYQTSRMPVRDALRELTRVGMLIEVGNGNHVVVPEFTRTDLLNVYLIQGMLHGLASRRIAERADRADTVQVLEKLAERMVTAEEAGEHQRMADLNWQFHKTINAAAGSHILSTALQGVAAFTPRDFAVEFPDSLRRSNVEHAELIEAIRDGRAGEAEEIARRHVVEAGDDYIDYYTRKGLALADQ